MNPTIHRARQQGVMLIEALIGLLIFSLGILALIGMQAVAMQYTIDAKYRSEASFLANQIVGTMWTDRTNLVNYDTSSGSGGTLRTSWISQVQLTLPQATGSNVPEIDVVGTQVTVTLRWLRPGDTTASNYSVQAQITDAN
jgi:type IV pilus assembly protein PilV